MTGLRLVRVQRKRVQNREILYIHLPKEYVERAGVKPGDYIAWEIDGRGRLILRKLR
ncbi:MAG TPA: AbrB/MazE/SpoVT family DNA-binding domain-containing protein [Aquificales bacterium]|nr:AbrB/MazE/SpoVT family DNA-binding domain-containing protein [Aquificales bacterium]